MAFKRKSSGGGKKPDLSIALSCKVGERKYEKGPAIGTWRNEDGGPAFRGSLKEDRLAQVLEFLSNAYEADLPVSVAIFTSDGDAPAKKKPSFSSGGGLKKPGFSKPNPFKKREEEEEQGEEGEGDDPDFE